MGLWESIGDPKSNKLSWTKKKTNQTRDKASQTRLIKQETKHHKHAGAANS